MDTSQDTYKFTDASERQLIARELDNVAMRGISLAEIAQGARHLLLRVGQLAVKSLRPANSLTSRGQW